MQTTLYPHIYAPRVPGMSRSRVLSTLELTQVRDLETLDVGVRELLQTCPNVPCNALLTAGYAIFKHECARRVQNDAAENDGTHHVLGGGFTLRLVDTKVLFCLTPLHFDLPKTDTKGRVADE